MAAGERRLPAADALRDRFFRIRIEALDRALQLLGQLVVVGPDVSLPFLDRGQLEAGSARLLA